MMQRIFRVTVTFVAASGVTVTRTVAIRDTSRISATARATANAVPATAKVIATVVA